MMRIRSARFGTLIAVCLVSVGTLVQSLPLLNLGFAETRADRRALAAVADTPGTFANLARHRLSPPDEPQMQVAWEEATLSADPLASAAWLDLAQTRLALGSPLDQVASALALSSLTGVNEAQVMAARSVFALPLWTTLPPTSQRSVIADLVGGWSTMDEPQRSALRTSVAALSEKAREGVKAGLLLMGRSGTLIVQDLLPPSLMPNGSAGG